MNTIKVSLKEIPKFTKPDALTTMDVVIFVRDQFEDPRSIVVLDTDGRLAEQDLAKYFIFASEEAASKCDRLQGLTSDAICVANLDRLGTEEPEVVKAYLDNYMAQYNVPVCTLCVVAQDVDRVKDFRDKLEEFPIIEMNVRYSYLVHHRIELLEDGLDISKAAAYIDGSKKANKFDFDSFTTVLRGLDEEITGGKRHIQSLTESLDQISKNLMLYLNLEYDLQPVNLESFINLLVFGNYMYDVNVLSMYERLNFLYKLPNVVGYANLPAGDICAMEVLQRVYPAPLFAYIQGVDKIVIMPEDLERDNDLTRILRPEVLNPAYVGNNISKLLDPRKIFEGSPDYFASSINSSLQLSTYSDYNTDKELTKLFARVEKKWLQYQRDRKVKKLEPAYISLKNSYIVEYMPSSGAQPLRILVYCRDTTGVLCQVYSDIDRNSPTVLVKEENFNKFIDINFVRRVVEESYARYIKEGSNFELATVYDKSLIATGTHLEPAIPPKVRLAINLLPPTKNGLSYYDKILRTTIDILPIVLDGSSKLYKLDELFNYISLEQLREDYVASTALSSCGTLRDFGHNVLPLSVDAFRKVVGLLV